MALTTWKEAKTQYLENISWRGNLAMAILFVEAIDALDLLRATKFSDADGQESEFALIASKRSEAVAFINSTSSAVKANRTNFTRGVMR